MKVFTVDEPLFKTEPLFVIGCSHEQLNRYLKKRFTVDVGEDCGQIGQMLTYQKTPWRVVWAKHHNLAVVLHEVFHLVTRICEDRGIPIKAHGEDGQSHDEPAAFMFEFYARAVIKRLGYTAVKR